MAQRIIDVGIKRGRARNVRTGRLVNPPTAEEREDRRARTSRRFAAAGAQFGARTARETQERQITARRATQTRGIAAERAASSAASVRDAIANIMKTGVVGADGKKRPATAADIAAIRKALGGGGGAAPAAGGRVTRAPQRRKTRAEFAQEQGAFEVSVKERQRARVRTGVERVPAAPIIVGGPEAREKVESILSQAGFDTLPKLPQFDTQKDRALRTALFAAQRGTAAREQVGGLRQDAEAINTQALANIGLAQTQSQALLGRLDPSAAANQAQINQLTLQTAQAGGGLGGLAIGGAARATIQGQIDLAAQRQAEASRAAGLLSSATDAELDRISRIPTIGAGVAGSVLGGILPTEAPVAAPVTTPTPTTGAAVVPVVPGGAEGGQLGGLIGGPSTGLELPPTGAAQTLAPGGAKTAQGVAFEQAPQPQPVGQQRTFSPQELQQIADEQDRFRNINTAIIPGQRAIRQPATAPAQAPTAAPTPVEVSALISRIRSANPTITLQQAAAQAFQQGAPQEVVASLVTSIGAEEAQRMTRPSPLQVGLQQFPVQAGAVAGAAGAGGGGLPLQAPDPVTQAALLAAESKRKIDAQTAELVKLQIGKEKREAGAERPPPDVAAITQIITGVIEQIDAPGFFERLTNVLAGGGTSLGTPDAAVAERTASTIEQRLSGLSEEDRATATATFRDSPKLKELIELRASLNTTFDRTPSKPIRALFARTRAAVDRIIAAMQGN